ncbi:MAG: MmcQ/YjbR family DNA-binding protein [Clostridia bacterium]|nr:MmcQ/YjbR family DNA-binding protein [Clostridia bacterium]
MEGIYPAYHMNKTHWISIAMDDRVPRVLVQDLLDQSYASTASAPRRQKKR